MRKNTKMIVEENKIKIINASQSIEPPATIPPSDLICYISVNIRLSLRHGTSMQCVLRYISSKSCVNITLFAFS